jgi:hypothetical protein
MVMVYAKLYPTTLVEEYRKAVRGSFLAVHGSEALANPSAEEWEALSASCEMRDMEPTSAPCRPAITARAASSARGNPAQPKQSAAPVFARMRPATAASSPKPANAASPAGQIAARELGVERISSALRRARELQGDVAEAIEAHAL